MYFYFLKKKENVEHMNIAYFSYVTLSHPLFPAESGRT